MALLLQLFTFFTVLKFNVNVVTDQNTKRDVGFTYEILHKT